MYLVMHRLNVDKFTVLLLEHARAHKALSISPHESLPKISKDF